MTGNPAEGYATLAALLERELSLVRARRLDGLAALHDAQARLRDELPHSPPPQARPLLQRCRELQEGVEGELLAAREAILLELRRVHHAERAAHGYTPMRPRVVRVQASA